jgi:hypothetical protein
MIGERSSPRSWGNDETKTEDTPHRRWLVRRDIERGVREFLTKADAGSKANAKHAAAVEMILALGTEKQ